MKKNYLRSIFFIGILFFSALFFAYTVPQAPRADAQILTQGRPPARCSRRLVDVFQAYFTIENPRIQLGDSIRLDATCTVGEITTLRWDFDTDAWPESTLHQDRFEPPLLITKRGKDNDDIPFTQVYTPTTPGTKIARLWARDLAGNEQVVIHTYVVENTITIGRLALTDQQPLQTHFIVEDSVHAQIPEPRVGRTPVEIPYYVGALYQGLDGASELARIFKARAVGSRGALQSITWSLFDDANARRIKDYTQDPVSSFIHSFSSDLIDFSGRTKLALAASSLTGRHDTYEVKYKMVSPSTALNPQLTFIPSEQGDISDPFSQVSFEDEHFSYPSRPGNRFKLKPKQQFTLQNYSIIGLVRPTNNYQAGEVTVEFDSGNGQFVEAGRVPAGIIEANGSLNELKGYYPLTYIKKTFTAPTRPGIYTARMRITEAAVGSQMRQQSGTVRIVYEVLRDDSFLRITPAPHRGRVNNNVHFDAQRSRGTFTEYHWQIFRDDGTPVADSVRKISEMSTRAAEYFTHKFSEEGAYMVRLTVTEQDGTRTFKEIRYRVGKDVQSKATGISVKVYAQGVVSGGDLPDPGLMQNDVIVFEVIGLKHQTMSGISWDFDNDGRNDEQCTIEAGSEGYATCAAATKEPRHQSGTHSASFSVFAKDGSLLYGTEFEYVVLPGDRQGIFVPSSQPPPTIIGSPGLAGIRPRVAGGQVPQGSYQQYPEIYADDALFFEVLTLNSPVTKVEWDFENNGSFDSQCYPASFITCGAVYKSPPHTAGNYTAHLRITALGLAQPVERYVSYTILGQSRPAGKRQ